MNFIRTSIMFIKGYKQKLLVYGIPGWMYINCEKEMSLYSQDDKTVKKII